MLGFSQVPVSPMRIARDDLENGDPALQTSCSSVFVQRRVGGGRSWNQGAFEVCRTGSTIYDQQSGRRSWVVNNSSAYLWDVSLWTACRESRRVIRAHFNSRELKEARLDYRLCCGGGCDSCPVCLRTLKARPVIVRARHDKKKLRIVTEPCQDLFCIDAPEIDEWGVQDVIRYFSEHCIHGYNRFTGIKNIGLEFNPRWIDDLTTSSLPKDSPPDDRHIDVELETENGTRLGFILRFMEVSAETFFKGSGPSQILWLVDRLSRCAEVTVSAEEFYDCNLTYAESVINPSDEGYCTSASRFLDMLQHMAVELEEYAYEEWHNAGRPGGIFSYRITSCIKVLTCRDDSSHI